MLVKPGNVDTYADLLEGVPDLVPPQAEQYDAMAGRPSPTSMREAGPFMAESGGFGQDAPIARPQTGRGAAVQGVPELGAVALPPAQGE